MDTNQPRLGEQEYAALADAAFRTDSQLPRAMDVLPFILNLEQRMSALERKFEHLLDRLEKAAERD